MKTILIVIGFLIMVGVIVWDGRRQVESIEGCKRERIIPLGPDFFSWEGINKLAREGKYQPKCL
jgi:hypothetical protein